SLGSRGIFACRQSRTPRRWSSENRTRGTSSTRWFLPLGPCRSPGRTWLPGAQRQSRSNGTQSPVLFLLHLAFLLPVPPALEALLLSSFAPTLAVAWKQVFRRLSAALCRASAPP